MGADGFGWVRWGAGSMGGHRNNACGDNNGHAGPDFGPYGRGNFPGHHVFQGMAHMGFYGCGRVHMGSCGCIREQGHGRNEKQAEKKQKWSCHGYFDACQGEKKQEVGRDG